MKLNIIKITSVIAIALILGSCQKGDLLSNPNVANENSNIPVSLLLNHLTWSMYRGGGVVEKTSNAVGEEPFGQLSKWNQFTVSTNAYYRATNAYAFSNTATAYDLLRYVKQMESQAQVQLGTTNSVYSALGRFFKAYSFVWLTQRVGDIPAGEAGDSKNLTPKFEAQKDVYKRSLQLLDEANSIITIAIKPGVGADNSNLVVGGDIYGLTYLQWQKVINSYRLRVLISLSKRADDNADLNVKQQFADILNNPGKYPIQTGNSDNLAFKYNATVNKFIYNPDETYNVFENLGKTYLDLTTANQDPRTFIAATPAPAEIKAGKTVSDFTAYVGGSTVLTQSTLSANDAKGMYSYVNYKRYFTTFTGPDPAVMIGYPELCFNIAEAINRGWAAGSAANWYQNGIKASISFYGLTEGQSYDIGDVKGVTLGKVTIKINDFLNHPNVVYKGDNADGLKQILQQKYVAFFENSAWEAFYNWRRTGIPEFANNGPGINPSGVIPVRWQYPLDEQNNNTSNYKAAVSAQYGGNDEVNQKMWLLK